MSDFELYVNGDEAVLTLNQSHLASDAKLHIHNNLVNPTDRIYITFASSAAVNWQGIIELVEGSEADLLIFLKSTTHIYNGSFTGFNSVLLTDHKISSENRKEILPNEEANNNVRLIIDNFKAKEGYIFCNNLSLLKGGKITDKLGIKLHGSNPQITLTGNTVNDYLVLNNLEIRTEVNQLILDKVVLNGNFSHAQINNLLVNNSIASDSWKLENVKSIKGLSLHTLGTNNQIFTDSIEITNLLSPRGKFYISAKSYINFKIEPQGGLSGIDLVLDMSGSSLANKKVTFPAQKFRFDYITIIKADDVSITVGGSCKQLLLEDCSKVVAYNLEVGDIKYYSRSQPGKLYASGKILNNLMMIGEVEAVLNKMDINNIEGIGLCSVNFSNGVTCKMLQLNLNLDTANLNNQIQAGKSVIRIENIGQELTKIDTILAKLSTFYIKGNVELGNVLIQTIDKLVTLLWVDLVQGSKLKLNSLFVGFDHQIVVSRDGTISVVKADRTIKGSEIYASVSAVSSNYTLLSAGEGLRFDGSLRVLKGDIAFKTTYGDLFVKGTLSAQNQLILIAKHGDIHVKEAVLDAKSIILYSNTSSYVTETLMKAESLVIYSLNNHIQIDKSKLTACKIAIVSSGDTSVSASHINSQAVVMKGRNVAVNNSEIITHNIFIQAIHDFLFINSGIQLVQHSHVLFSIDTSSNSNLIQGGFKIANDVTLIGVFSSDQNNPLPKLQWKYIDFAGSVKTADGTAYIDAKNGYIIGGTIAAKESVIIKTSHSLEILPLPLYNEVMLAGGMNTNAIKEVISRINAGTIDIDAGKAATFVGSLLKAANGSIKADVLHLLNSPAEIVTQQGRIKELVGWVGKSPIYADRVSVGKYFEFSKSTSIEQRIGNLNFDSSYISTDLSFTKTYGDIVIDKSFVRNGKLYLSAASGKILIVSENLQNIYREAGGGEAGRNAAYQSRTVIGGDNVYLVADEVISQAGKFEVKGDFKIITKNGVHFLPVAVHERLMYHLGSKTTVDEYVVRQVVSEINAGYLEVKASGVFEAVSTLINATGVKLDVKELKLRAEYDIFERNVHFQGKEKWYGGSRSSQDYTKDALVLPTIINTDNFFAKVTGDTTIEAAQILTKEEQILQAGGNIQVIPKYDIHVHDHVSSKSYLFKFNGGKMTIAGTKTTKEYFYGESVVPTLYYSGGSFYALSDGKIHLLGAKIISDDIYLVGQKGVKIEAAPYHQNKFVSFTESGMRIGYNAGGGQASISGELFKNINKNQYTAQLYEASEIIAKNKLVIAAKDGKIEVISSSLKFAKAEITAKELHFGTHKEQHNVQRTTTTMQAGIHIGMQEDLSCTAKLANHLIHKNGTHWLDVLDRALNLYQLGSQTMQIAGDIRKLVTSTSPAELKNNLQNLDCVRFGVWASARATTTNSDTIQNIAVDNMIIGGDIDIMVNGEAVIEGIICNVDNFKLKAASLRATASHDTTAHETTTAEMELIIPIYGNVRGGLGVNSSEATTTSTSYHDNNMIMVKGQLDIDIAGDGRISGIRVQAAEVKVRAKNLVVESLQDVIQERMSSMQMSVGFNNAGTYKELGGKAEVASRSAAWTNAVGSIIGTQVTHVVVQQTLEIAGGLIANAEVNPDGSLTDKGRLYVEAGSIVAKQLHDYDNGKSFGLGATLTKKAGSDGKLKWGVGIPVVCSFDEQSRDILPVIGKGEIKLTGSSSVPTELSRNVNRQIGTTTGERASLRATVPVSDMVEFISSALKPQYQGAVAAGDEGEKGIVQQILSWFAGQEEQPSDTINASANEPAQNTEYLNINIKPDERSVEELAQGFDPERMYVPIKFVKPSGQPKTLNDVYNSLKNDFGLGGRHQLHLHPYNSVLLLVSATGELIDYGTSNFGYGISSIQGAPETLSVIGHPINVGLGYVKGKIKEGGRLVFGNEQYNSLAKWYSELPNGTQLYGTQVSDGFILAGGGKIIGISADVAKASASGVLKTFVKTESALGTEFVTAGAIESNAAISLEHHFKLSESYLNNQIDNVLGGAPYNQSLRELTALEIRVACEELAMQGEGKVMAGAGHAVPIKDINRLINTYGGTSEEWAKMSSKAIVLKEGLVLKSGTKVQAHYYKNIRTGQVIEIKPKLQ